jgi:hypothetical protein
MARVATRKLAASTLLRGARASIPGAAPLVLVVDDLQWADGDTIEWLQYFVRSTSGTRCLVVGTVRAEEEQDNPPLGRLLGHLERESLLTTIALGPIDRTAIAQLAGELAEGLPWAEQSRRQTRLDENQPTAGSPV